MGHGPGFTWKRQFGQSALHLGSAAARRYGRDGGRWGYWVCNTVWMLDDFTRGQRRHPGGAGIASLGSAHALRVLDLRRPHPDELLLTGEAGTVVVMNAQSGTAAPPIGRRASLCLALPSIARRDKPQQQYQKTTASSGGCRKGLRRSFEDSSPCDDPLNDELSSYVVRTSGFLK